MGSTRRPAKNYIEVPDSDSDDDFYIPESSNSAQTGAESRLKRQKTSGPDAKLPSSSDIPGEAKRAAAEPNPSSVVDVDDIGLKQDPVCVSESKDESGDVKCERRENNAGDVKALFEFSDDGADSSECEKLIWPGKSASSKEHISNVTNRAVQVHNESSRDIFVDSDNSRREEIVTRKRKSVATYKDESDDSFKIEDESSNDEDSSSEFEMPVPKKKTKGTKNSPPGASKRVQAQKNAGKNVAKKPKSADQYDSDGSFNLGNDGDDTSSEFEIEAPKKTKVVKQQSISKKAAPRKLLGKPSSSRTTASKEVKQPHSKVSKGGTGSSSGKRLGARLVLKPLAQKSEKSSSERRAPLRTTLSGPRYRSGLSRNQPISNRLHSYKDSKTS